MEWEWNGFHNGRPIRFKLDGKTLPIIIALQRSIMYYLILARRIWFFNQKLFSSVMLVIFLVFRSTQQCLRVVSELFGLLFVLCDSTQYYRENRTGDLRYVMTNIICEIYETVGPFNPFLHLFLFASSPPMNLLRFSRKPWVEAGEDKYVKLNQQVHTKPMYQILFVTYIVV